MKLFDRFKKKTQKTETPRETKSKKSAKEIATEKGEPYVAILSMDINPDNLHEGAFELDWNSLFVTRLIKAGYMIKKDDTDRKSTRLNSSH